MLPSSRPISLPALTGVRFFAAALVVWAHFAPPPARLGDDAGSVAVTIFFLLSGFILTYTARPGPVPPREFYVARLARIYPAYLVGLGLAVVLLPTGMYVPSALCPASAPAVLPSLLLVQAWLPSRAACLNGPAWSLSCEAFFYALFPLLLPLVRRVPHRRIGHALVACWAVGMALPVAFIGAKHAEMTAGLSPALALTMNVLFRHESPLARVPDFLCGMLVGRLYCDGMRLWRPRVALALAGVWTVVVQGGIGLYGPVDEALLWPAVAVLLLALAQGGSLPARILSRRELVLLGEASYGLYILHWPLHGVLQALGLLSPLAGGWPAYAAYASCAVALSLLSLRFLETPARRTIRAALGRQHAERTGPARNAAA